MNPYQMFATDEKIESEGITLDYGDFKIKIARSGGANQKYTRVLTRLAKPLRKAIDHGTIDKKVADDMLMQAHAEAVVLGWEGVTDKKGKKIEFNKENCLKLFRDLPDLFADIQEQAGKAGLFRKELNEEIVGN